MKYYLTPLLTALTLITLLPTPTPTLAQGKKLEFYCGRTQDANPKPMTIATMHGAQKEIGIIVWTDLQGLSARKRCEIVSTRFQTAWDRGSFNYFGSGVDRNGLGLICAIKDKGQNCDRHQVLFTLKSGQESKDIIQRLQGIFKSNGVNNPLYQSSGDFPAIEMQDLIKALSTPVN
jgi:hypothetical protein